MERQSFICQNQEIMSRKIFLSPPHMGTNEQKYIDEVFRSNYIAPLGAFVDRFESSIIEHTGTKSALATISATAAIHLALRVLGVGKDDIVLASSFTFIGSVAPILYQDATPMFVDSDKSWNLSPKLLKEAIKKAPKRPKALILTHLYGQMAHIDEIVSICKESGIYLIEDAAESLGASYGGRQSGAFGDFGIFSFNGNKLLTTSGGGMLVSDSSEWIDRASFYATGAKERAPHYEHIEYGYNYRMSNVLAAIGVAQMEVLKSRVHKAREIFSWYGEELGDSVEFMPEIENSRGNRWLTTLTLTNSSVMKIIKALDQNNIEARMLWKPMHMQPLFKESLSVIDGTSQRLFESGLCLPSGTELERSDIEHISSIIRECL